MARPLFLSKLTASFAAILLSSVNSAHAEKQYMTYHLKWVEKGSFLVKTIHELGTEEGQVLLNALCAAVGTDCSAIAMAAGVYRFGETNAGNQHWDNIMSPKGWAVCDIKYDGGPSPESSVSITWRHDDRQKFEGPGGNGPDGISLYFDVPKNENRGHWIDMNIYISYVPYAERDKYKCLPQIKNAKGRTDLDVYNCKGGGNSPTMPTAYRNCR